MSIKDIFKKIIPGKPDTEADPDGRAPESADGGDVLLVRAGGLDMNRYKKIPIARLTELGSTFGQVPAAIRMMVQNVRAAAVTDETLFVAVNPRNINGYLQMNTDGITGNIMRINEQGKHVIAGRMRFKPVRGIATLAKSRIFPIDPVSVMIATILVHIDQKIDRLQKTATEILQFLTIDKQAKQRGNLNTLREIFDEYKQDSGDEKRCMLRNIEVQTIGREARQDMLFYQEQIAQEMKKQQMFHSLQQARGMMANTVKSFQEYKLACYLYSFASFLDILLRKDFSARTLYAVKQKLGETAERYVQLYGDCHAQLEKYQKTSLETQIIGGIGSAARSVGRALESVPVLKRSTLNETLANAGDALDNRSREMLLKALDEFETIEDIGIHTFMENVETVDLMHNCPDGMMTDGEDLYILRTELTPAAEGDAAEIGS